MESGGHERRLPDRLFRERSTVLLAASEFGGVSASRGPLVPNPPPPRRGAGTWTRRVRERQATLLFGEGRRSWSHWDVGSFSSSVREMPLNRDGSRAYAGGMSDRNLLADIRPLLTTPEPPQLGPGPRPGVRSIEDVRATLQRSLKNRASQAREDRLIEAVVLLWHDHHDPAHFIVQDLEDADGSFVHGILHRREPDYGNAAYWFRRVGRHPGFATLAERVATLPVDGADREFKQRLVAGGKWDPFAFIDACAEVTRGGERGPRGRFLREVQRREFEVLLERFCA